ncbi:relaxase/mobilization nuclease domain-containing protein [Flavobacterium sp. 17A]|uniref:Relaxase/mobilization nuclease domain-containing protein n=1 Tax=Flavobacterium potami TaxID=2872310 RepID=A0A9X1KSA2_9FLAO|nr:relaxase/mobilization nuclease domain-containing protein [Flavobacterium potami]MBZ4037793.1 relaxase/mobilization nuclease domain-containing protein [Flavobacterium potami]
MIAKISTGINTHGMVSYNHNKTIPNKKGEKEGLLLAVNSINNDKLSNIVSTISSFNNKNKSVSKPNIHISLNFHKDDILSNEKIVEIAKDYLNEMGYKDQPYAIYRHFDREHPHIHIVSSQINADGKKINDSHIYYRSQKLTRDLEEKYEITKAVEKKGVLDKIDIYSAIHEHLEFGKHSLTAIMKRALIEVMEQKPTSEKQFEYLLSNYQVKRLISSDAEDNIKGHFFDLLPLENLTDENYTAKSKGINGFDLDSSFSYHAIMMQIESNVKQKEIIQKGIMGKIYSIINPLQEKQRISKAEEAPDKIFKENLSEFTLKMKKKGIEIVVKRSQTGDNPGTIYGLLFKDIKTSHVYSATEIKLKTKDFLELIHDDLKNLNQTEISSKISELIDVTPEDFSQNPIEDNLKETFSFFDSLSEMFGNNNVGPNRDDTPVKPKRRRKRGL